MKAITGLAIVNVSILQERFDSKTRRMRSGCHLWTASTSIRRDGTTGYGFFWDGFKLWRAHRWIWTQTRGPIPDGMYVLHDCDRPPCVNVEHLALGSAQDNSDDMHSRGRFVVVRCFGSDNGATNLTETDVLQIRADVAAGELQVSVGKRYGISSQCMSNIILRRRWTHI